MIEWSDVDIAVRDAVREFVDKEIRPHVDALKSGEMEPYPIVRKLFATFGIAEMSRESLNKRLARLRDGGESSGKSSGGGGMFGDGAGGMGFVVVSELCRVSMGIVTGMGVSLGLTVPTIRPRHARPTGALAARAGDLRQDRRLGDHRARLRLRCVRRHEVLRRARRRRLHPQRPEDVHHQRPRRGRGRRVRQTRRGRRRRQARPQGAHVRPRPRYGGLRPVKALPQDGHSQSRTGELFFNNVRLGRDRLLGETEDS